MSAGVQLIIDNFKSFFKKEFINTMAVKLTQSIEISLNKLINKSACLAVLTNEKSNSELGIFFNYTLVGKPLFKRNYVVFPLDASFLTNENQKPVSNQENFNEMPFTANSQKMAQLFVSEYTLNSAMKAFHERRMIKEAMMIDVTYVKLLFPYFQSSIYGEDFAQVEVQFVTETT